MEKTFIKNYNYTVVAPNCEGSITDNVVLYRGGNATIKSMFCIVTNNDQTTGAKLVSWNKTFVVVPTSTVVAEGESVARSSTLETFHIPDSSPVGVYIRLAPNQSITIYPFIIFDKALFNDADVEVTVYIVYETPDFE